MSSHIVFRQHAILHRHATLQPHIPEGHWLYSDDHYVLIEEGGSSNMFDANDRIARDWYGVATGAAWVAMQEVVQISASCEGGTLKLRGKWVKPETYIGAWRAAIKLANEEPVRLASPHSPLGRIKLHDDCVAAFPEHARKQLALLESRPERRGQDQDGREYAEWSFWLSDPAQYVIFHLAKDLARYTPTGQWGDQRRAWSQIT